MRILILHSDVPPDAPPDDQDTLHQANAVESTLHRLGHKVTRCAFESDPRLLESALARECPDLVFNLVETVWGTGVYANLAPAMLTRLGVPFTGCGAAALAVCGDKLVAKRLLAGAGLPTPDWSEPPGWPGIGGERWSLFRANAGVFLGFRDMRGWIFASMGAVIRSFSRSIRIPALNRMRDLPLPASRPA